MFRPGGEPTGREYRHLGLRGGRAAPAEGARALTNPCPQRDSGRGSELLGHPAPGGPPRVQPLGRGHSRAALPGHRGPDLELPRGPARRHAGRSRLPPERHTGPLHALEDPGRRAVPRAGTLGAFASSSPSARAVSLTRSRDTTRTCTPAARAPYGRLRAARHPAAEISLALIAYGSMARPADTSMPRGQSRPCHAASRVRGGPHAPKATLGASHAPNATLGYHRLGGGQARAVGTDPLDAGHHGLPASLDVADRLGGGPVGDGLVTEPHLGLLELSLGGGQILPQALALRRTVSPAARPYPPRSPSRT